MSYYSRVSPPAAPSPPPQTATGTQVPLPPPRGVIRSSSPPPDLPLPYSPRGVFTRLPLPRVVHLRPQTGGRKVDVSVAVGFLLTFFIGVLILIIVYPD